MCGCRWRSSFRKDEFCRSPRRDGFAERALGKRQNDALSRARRPLAVRKGRRRDAEGLARALPAAAAVSADRHPQGGALLSGRARDARRRELPRGARSLPGSAISRAGWRNPRIGRWLSRSASSSASPSPARSSIGRAGFSSTRARRRSTRRWRRSSTNSLKERLQGHGDRQHRASAGGAGLPRPASRGRQGGAHDRRASAEGGLQPA